MGQANPYPFQATIKLFSQAFRKISQTSAQQQPLQQPLAPHPFTPRGTDNFALQSSSLPTSSLPFTQGYFTLDKTSECSQRAASSAPRDVLRPASLTRAKYATSSQAADPSFG